MFALVRTAERDKKQDGISFVLIDLSLPGVTIRPIVNLAGDDEFCEVFFDDARVPLTEVVGELHAGWTIAKSLLGFERLFNGSPRTSVRTLHQLQALAKQQGHFDNACFFDSFAELNLEAIDLKALYMHYENIVRSGHPLPQSVSILKVSCSVLTTWAMVSRPTTSAVRKVPELARPSFLPVKSSTTS